MNLYVVFDVLAGESGPVFESKNDETAARAFRRLLQEQRSVSSEYRLMRIGTIDHAGSVLVVEQPWAEVKA